VFFGRLRRDAKISGQKTDTQFGYKFFFRIAYVAPFLFAKITIKALWMACPVRDLMVKGGISIKSGFMKYRAYALAYVSLGLGKEVFDPLIALLWICRGLIWHLIIGRWQAIDLAGIEHGVLLQERDLFFSLFILLFLGDLVGANHLCALFSFAHGCFELHSLVESHLMRRRVAFLGKNP
jgi:hypothetical protein